MKTTADGDDGATPSDGGGKLTTLEDLLCGAFGGGCARMCIAPIDVVKIRFQVQSDTPHLFKYTSSLSAMRHIAENEGPRALWKGNAAAMLMVVPYASLQFAAFYQLQQSPLVAIADPYRSLVFGAASGAFATALTYPLDLLRTVFAAQTEPRTYTGLGSAVRSICRSHGVRGLYAGFGPTLIEIVPYVAIAFASYESAKAYALERRPDKKLSTLDSLVIGASTGTFSKLVTLPLDNAKKRMQIQGHFAEAGKQSEVRYSGMIDCLAKSYARVGVRGWFRGLSPSLIKAAPNSAVTFAAYEFAKRTILSRKNPRKE
jgi:solute carrier family 25 thiamine pyrophosphate transporter 19